MNDNDNNHDDIDNDNSNSQWLTINGYCHYLIMNNNEND